MKNNLYTIKIENGLKDIKLYLSITGGLQSSVLLIHLLSVWRCCAQQPRMKPNHSNLFLPLSVLLYQEMFLMKSTIRDTAISSRHVQYYESEYRLKHSFAAFLTQMCFISHTKKFLALFTSLLTSFSISFYFCFCLRTTQASNLYCKQLFTNFLFILT